MPLTVNVCGGLYYAVCVLCTTSADHMPVLAMCHPVSSLCRPCLHTVGDLRMAHNLHAAAILWAVILRNLSNYQLL